MHHARYLGNLGELLYNKSRSLESMRFFKDGRIQAWLQMRDFGLEIEPVNINFAAERNGVLVDSAREKTSEEVLAQYSGGGGAPAAAAGKAA